METSVGGLHAALASADIPEIAKTKTAIVYKKAGGKFEYRYASLDDIMKKIRKPLAEKGLVITHDLRENYAQCYTRLTHAASGESIEIPYPTMISGGDTHQSLGAKMTYARRYGLCLLLGLAPDEDIDGEEIEDKYEDGKRQPAQADVKKIKNCKTVKELATMWQEGFTKEQRQTLGDLKSKIKKELMEKERRENNAGNVEPQPTPAPPPYETPEKTTRRKPPEPRTSPSRPPAEPMPAQNKKQSRRKRLMPASL